MQQHAVLPQKLEESKLAELYERVRKGEQDAKNQMIMAHTRLGFSKVAEFAVGNPNKIEDMSSKMLECLVEGVNKIEEGAVENHDGTPNVTGYLLSKVNGGILRLLMNAKRKQPLPAGKVHHPDPVHYSDTIEVVTLAIESVQKRIRSDNPKLVAETIRLRLEGLSDQEVADALGISRQRIQQIRILVQEEIKRLS